MVTLDVTIVNIALPSAQKALHFSAENRQWAVTAYALSFGSLLAMSRARTRAMSCATEGFSARIAMALDSLASIGNLSLQRPSVSIASHWDPRCWETSVVTLNLPHWMIADVNVSPGAVYLANAFGESGSISIFELRRWCQAGMAGKLFMFPSPVAIPAFRRDNHINDHRTRTPPEVA